jgi:hypothetical protein
MTNILKKEEKDLKLMPIKIVEDGVVSAFFVCKSEGDQE